MRGLAVVASLGTVGAVIWVAGRLTGYRLGHRAGRDAVVVWMLEHAAMPENWREVFV